MLYNTLTAPITAQVELTTGCDNDCLYCYNHWRHDKEVPGANLHRNLLEKTIDELIKNKVFQVTFTGGEVLLRKNELFYGLEKLIHAGISCAVNSNLTLLTTADAKRLYEIGLRGIMTSVSAHIPSLHDYISQRNSAFAKTMAGIQCAQEAGLFVAVSMVVTKLNVHHVYETGKAMNRIGVRQFFATKASPPVNAINFDKFLISNEELQQVLESLHRLKADLGLDVGVLECYPLCGHADPERYSFVADRRCSAGVTTCTIGADGGVRPCSHSEVVYGNIAIDGLARAWQNMTDQRDGSQLPQTCKSCSLLAECSGGCRVDAMCCNGQYDTLDPYARPEQVSIIKLIPRFPERIGKGLHFKVESTLHTREESFGVLCASAETASMPALLTHDTRDLLAALNQSSFTTEDISAVTGASLEDAETLCAMLVRDKVIRVV